MKQNATSLEKLKFIDLFAGVGGFHLAMSDVGGECVFASEIDKYAQQTYKENFGIMPYGDITQIDEKDVPQHDVLCGGFPCQAFSVAGKRLGFEDARGTMFFHIARIVKEKQPQVLFLENVKGLLSHDNGKTFETIKNILNDLGYHIHYKVLSGTEYGNTRQLRSRVFIVAFKDKKAYDAFSFPEAVLLTRQFSDYIDVHSKVDDKYYLTAEKYPKYFGILKDAYDTLSQEEKERGDNIFILHHSKMRVHKNGVFPTLVASMGTGGHRVPFVKDDFGFRKLMPRECFTIQSFPNSFKLPNNMSDAHLYKQAGNSVVVDVVRRIAQNMVQAIKAAK